ncbi:hypothetical protein [Bacillus sp. B1-b2]|uniref:hypothetical protein n=1 Tax=Bacillus sp. B1-b2 TaxID=2653201 RepID=UPI0012625E0C|nr:hypothetical protein [Bacillus sp. B1-b2]KAB7667591.1 hypothetical protein F9279_15135 [Bacillus sp. B1-b2]
MRPKILRTFVYLVIIIAIGLVFSFYKIYDADLFKSDNAEYSVTIVGLIISVIAFLFAFLTYVSIDSVNKITQMDGNVLENENYITSFTSLISEYDMEDSSKFSKHVLKNLKDLFKYKSKTAVQFANNLQMLIDLLVFLPYMYHSEGEKAKNQKKMKKILKIINKREKTLLAVSNGNLVLISETVKLIESVLNYQEHVHTDEFKKTSTLLEVRGNMLRNSVTQMVYCNYKGLYYQKKAIGVLQKKYGIPNGNTFMYSKLKLIKRKILSLENHDKELFIIYLKEAQKSFDKAVKQGSDDVMWEGFIKFNAARTCYLLSIVGEETIDNWYSMMNEALSARYRLSILIDDILQDKETTHLQEAFKHESNMAELVKINILMAEELDITNRTENLKYSAPFYQGLQEETLLTVSYNKHFEIIVNLQKEIIHYLQEIDQSTPVA